MHFNKGEEDTRNFTKRLLAAGLGFVALGSFPQSAIGSEDGGEPPMLSEESIALEAASHAVTYGVSEVEAIRRLALMHDANASISSIATGLGDDLGGLYFENGAEFALTGNTTGKGRTVPDESRAIV